MHLENRMWSFNDQNSKLYDQIFSPLSASTVFRWATCIWEGCMDSFSSSSALDLKFSHLMSGPFVTGARGRKERKGNKKVLSGTLSVVSWLWLSGQADGWRVTLPWSTLVDSSDPCIWDFLMPCLSMQIAILCDLPRCFLQSLGILSPPPIFHCWSLFTLLETQGNSNPCTFSHGKFSLIFKPEQLRKVEAKSHAAVAHPAPPSEQSAFSPSRFSQGNVRLHPHFGVTY